MTNKICLFLIVCLVFSCCSLPVIALDGEPVNTNNDDDSCSVNLLSSGDFYLELEKEGINAEDSEEYNIFGRNIGILSSGQYSHNAIKRPIIHR